MLAGLLGRALRAVGVGTKSTVLESKGVKRTAALLLFLLAADPQLAEYRVEIMQVAEIVGMWGLGHAGLIALSKQVKLFIQKKFGDLDGEEKTKPE